MPGNSQRQEFNPWLFWKDVTESLFSPSMMALAPQRLWQSILPGWIFAENVMINPQNSSAPDAELAILAQISYGRQLGKVIDALDVLIRTGSQPAEEEDQERLKALTDLHDQIRNIKDNIGTDRISRIRRDLKALKATRPHDYAELVSSLVD